MKNRVVLRYLDGKNKIDLLNDVLSIAGLEETLEDVRLKTGKKKDDFAIAVKPNASMFIRRDEEGVTTDAVLVLALVERLVAGGYRRVSVVESSNLYEAGFADREPIRVMAAQGLAGGLAKMPERETRLTAHVLGPDGRELPYELVDLGADTVTYKTGTMPRGAITLGREWAEADFRVSFSAFKTHIYDGYTLLVKNTYGCLPEGNKMWHYHHKTGAARPALVQLELCPVHFGVIDAITGADGQAGVKWDRAIPRRPGFIMAGDNIGAVEKEACGIMGVRFKRSYMSRPAIERLANEYVFDGSPRPLKPWVNVFPPFVAAMPVLERFYYPHRFIQMMSDFTGNKVFRRKPVGKLFTVLTCLMLVIPFLYALQKRHWPLRIRRDMAMARFVKRKTGKNLPRRWACELNRLNSKELACLRRALAEAREAPEIFGHKLRFGGRVVPLPDSNFFNLERIRWLMADMRDRGTDLAAVDADLAARMEYTAPVTSGKV